MIIRNRNEVSEETGEFINRAFSDYGTKNNIELNFSEYCFTAEENGEIIGVITGRAYYNEVHIGDLIIDEKFRHTGLGTKLVRAVEEAYTGKGYSKITLTTFGFQAPEFYRKLGYSPEFVREDENAKLSKYFYIKALK